MLDCIISTYEIQEVPLCRCGCGKSVGFWSKTNRSCGRIKGQPKRFINGHGGYNWIKSKERAQPLETRFWKKVAFGSEDVCWLWLGSKQRYGVFYNSRHNYRAHRIAWILTYGPIPDGLLVCHHCDNPPCCNPKHLFLGTSSDNARDSVAKGRWPRCRKLASAKSMFSRR